MNLFTKASISIGALLVASAACAADLPTRKAPSPSPAYEPSFTWGGLYVGAFAGGNWSHVTPHDLTRPGFTGDPVLNANGLTAGGLAGYNFAFNNFVLGGEMEAGYDRREANANSLAPNVRGRNRGVQNLGDYGAAEGRVRGRIGYAWGNFLLFAAGGATAMDLQLADTNLRTGYSQAINHWRAGYNIGGGLEWAFSRNWIVRAEYIYDGFSARSYDFAGQSKNAIDSRSGKLQESTARAAIIYKF